VADAADAFIKALVRRQGGIYNLGSGEGFTVLQIVEFARKISGHSISVEMLASRPGEPGCLLAASNRAKIELGWQPKHSKIHDILHSAWDWYRHHPQGYGD
jgi:UDP-glucose 4-epimerase